MGLERSFGYVRRATGSALRHGRGLLKSGQCLGQESMTARFCRHPRLLQMQHRVVMRQVQLQRRRWRLGLQLEGGSPGTPPQTPAKHLKEALSWLGCLDGLASFSRAMPIVAAALGRTQIQSLRPSRFCSALRSHLFTSRRPSFPRRNLLHCRPLPCS